MKQGSQMKQLSLKPSFLNPRPSSLPCWICFSNGIPSVAEAGRVWLRRVSHGGDSFSCNMALGPQRHDLDTEKLRMFAKIRLQASRKGSAPAFCCATFNTVNANSHNKLQAEANLKEHVGACIADVAQEHCPCLLA